MRARERERRRLAGRQRGPELRAFVVAQLTRYYFGRTATQLFDAARAEWPEIELHAFRKRTLGWLRDHGVVTRTFDRSRGLTAMYRKAQVRVAA